MVVPNFFIDTGEKIIVFSRMISEFDIINIEYSFLQHPLRPLYGNNRVEGGKLSVWYHLC